MSADRWGGTAAVPIVTTVAVAMMTAMSPGLAAQTSPRPSFALRPPTEAERWTLEVDVPPGWALYGPDAGPVGLPLTGRWMGGDGEGKRARLTGPRPTHESYPWGTAPVHRGRVRFSLSSPREPGDILRLRWALCRPDLCVPGESVLRPSTRGPSVFAPGPGPGVREEQRPPL